MKLKIEYRATFYSEIGEQMGYHTGREGYAEAEADIATEVQKALAFPAIQRFAYAKVEKVCVPEWE